MSLCEGNWSSAIRWEKQKGTDVTDDKYVSDGDVHVCPYTGTAIRVTYTGLKNNKVLDGTCNKNGEDEITKDQRFKIDYTRTAGTGKNEKSYHYEGNGRVLNKGNGPAFIYGRVTVTADAGNSSNGDTGVWEAVRIGGHGGGPGTGEGTDVASAESTAKGT